VRLGGKGGVWLEGPCGGVGGSDGARLGSPAAGIRHKGPHGTGGLSCDTVARATSGSSAPVAAAMLAEVASMVVGAPRCQGR
jgi:hypothetical protein